MREADQADTIERPGSALGRIASMGFPALLVVGLAWLLILVHRSVYDGMLKENSFQVDTVALDIDPAPAWARPGPDDLTPPPFPFPGRVCPIHSPDLAKKLAAFYQSSPWVDHVERIEVLLPNQVRVRLAVREPVVAVRWDQTNFLVDKEGVRLPGEYPDLSQVPGELLHVSGIQGALPRPGQAWNDPGIPAGIAVASAIRDARLDQELAIETIDVGNVDGRIDPAKSEIVLRTGTAAAVEWGRSPWTKKYGEPSIDAKLENLRLALSAAPGLKGVRYLKLQFDRPYMAYR